MGVKRWMTRTLDRTGGVSVVWKRRQILEVCGGKEEECAENNCTLCSLLYCCIFFIMWKFAFLNLPCLNVDLLGRGTSSAGLPGDLSDHHFCSWVVERIISRAFQLLSCSANYQQSAFSCWVQRIISRALQLLSCSANYQQIAFSCWVQRIISRALHPQSCSANYQQSSSAAALFSELTAQHFSCWVVQRIISRARQLLRFSAN